MVIVDLAAVHPLIPDEAHNLQYAYKYPSTEAVCEIGAGLSKYVVVL